MTTPQPRESNHTDDRRLRQHLLDALARSPADGLQALEARALEQWRLRSPIAHGPGGPLAVLHGGWRHHPALCSGALLALGLAALLVIKPWSTPDPGIDELLQPDVLSLMTLGEL